MTTPRKQEIIREAMKINAERNRDISSNTPELEEIREDGIYEQARRNLMTSEATQYRSYIESEARSLGLIEDKIELAKQTIDVAKDVPFDVDLAKKGGTFVSGNRGNGKTNLAKIFVDRLLKNNVVIRVFDNSQAWRTSSVPNLIIAKRNHRATIDFDKSYVFDLSKLYVKEQKETVRKIVQIEYERQVELSPSQRRHRCFVFEESEILAPTHSLRKRNNPILSLVCVGRNFQLSFICLSQRASLISPTLISLSDQIYIGRSHEQNDKQKLRNWLGDWVEEIEDLKVGEFVFDRGSITKKFQCPIFVAKVKPIELPTYPLTKR